MADLVACPQTRQCWHPTHLRDMFGGACGLRVLEGPCAVVATNVHSSPRLPSASLVWELALIDSIFQHWECAVPGKFDPSAFSRLQVWCRARFL